MSSPNVPAACVKTLRDYFNSFLSLPVEGIPSSRERAVYYRYIDQPALIPVFADQLRRDLNFANSRSLKLLPGDGLSVVSGTYGPQVVTISAKDGEVSPPRRGSPDSFNLFDFSDVLNSSPTASITRALAEMQGPLLFTEDEERHFKRCLGRAIGTFLKDYIKRRIEETKTLESTGSSESGSSGSSQSKKMSSVPKAQSEAEPAKKPQTAKKSLSVSAKPKPSTKTSAKDPVMSQVVAKPTPPKVAQHITPTRAETPAPTSSSVQALPSKVLAARHVMPAAGPLPPRTPAIAQPLFVKRTTVVPKSRVSTTSTSSSSPLVPATLTISPATLVTVSRAETPSTIVTVPQAEAPTPKCVEPSQSVQNKSSEVATTCTIATTKPSEAKKRTLTLDDGVPTAVTMSMDAVQQARAALGAPPLGLPGSSRQDSGLGLLVHENGNGKTPIGLISLDEISKYKVNILNIFTYILIP